MSFSENDGYRYGFNGMEKVDEFTGSSSHYDFGARILDTRLGRWLSLDPLMWETPQENPYMCMGNNPLYYLDPDGRFKIPIHKRITRNAFKKSGLNTGWLGLFEDDVLLGVSVEADILGAFKDYHFDGRKNFEEVEKTWEELNKSIDSKIEDLGSVNRSIGGDDAVLFGRMLHTVQDFYAHSNYVELYVEYYQDANDGAMPTSVPTYDEGILIEGFRELMERDTFDEDGKYQGLYTGEFHLLDNEFWDFDPSGDKHTGPNSHKHTNKDKADTTEGKLAENVATKHVTKILKKTKEAAE